MNHTEIIDEIRKLINTHKETMSVTDTKKALGKLYMEYLALEKEMKQNVQ